MPAAVRTTVDDGLDGAADEPFFAPRSLWIDDVPMALPPCDGSYITIVMGAGERGIIGGLTKFSSPEFVTFAGPKYLRTDVTCESLNPTFSSGSLQGQPIYVVFYGPFYDRFDAQQHCLELGFTTKSECYVAPLTTSADDRNVRYGPNSR